MPNPEPPAPPPDPPADPAAVVNDLIERFHRRLVGYARGRAGGAAEDVVQDVWLYLLRRLREGMMIDPNTVCSLLFQAVYNRCIDFLRRTGREHLTDTGDAPEGADDAVGPVELALREEDVERVREAIGRLPERERAVVYLRVFEGLTLQEIADVLAISGPSQVLRILERALLRLREDLASHGPNP